MDIAETIENLKSQVFQKQKVLADIYFKHGQKSLFDYANSWKIGSLKPRPDFISAAKLLLEKLYPDIALNVLNQLKEHPLFSTIDHHGILNHPFFINSNLIFSLRQGQKYLVCLPTAGVSLNNSSWPGSLMYHDSQGNFRRASFFSDRFKHMPVLCAPPISQTAVNRFGFIKHLPAKLFGDESVFKLSNFSEQASVLSGKFWTAVFEAAPKVIYLPLEDLVSSLIADIICKNKNHVLHRLIFNLSGWQLLNKYFHGLKGAFNGDYGTFLYWAVDKKGQRQRIARGQDSLEFLLEPEGLIKRLKDKTIYPGSLLCFLVLLYSHVTCLGGFNQVNWLTEIKAKFIELLKEMDEQVEAEEISAVPTDNFAEGNLVFLYQNRRLIKPAALDIYLANDLGLYEKYRELGKIMTVGESIETLLPEIYKIVTPVVQRQQILLSVSDEQISQATSLNNKVFKILSI